MIVINHGNQFGLSGPQHPASSISLMNRGDAGLLTVRASGCKVLFYSCMRQYSFSLSSAPSLRVRSHQTSFDKAMHNANERNMTIANASHSPAGEPKASRRNQFTTHSFTQQRQLGTSGWMRFHRALSRHDTTLPSGFRAGSDADFRIGSRELQQLATLLWRQRL